MKTSRISSLLMALACASTVGYGCGSSGSAPPPTKPPVYTLARTIGSMGTGPGQFGQPNSLALDGLGDLYVLDTSRSHVSKFKTDGTFVTAFSITTGVSSPVLFIQYVAADPAGNFYVTGNLKHGPIGSTVLKYDAQGNNLPLPKLNLNVAANPKGIAIATDGTIAVAEGGLGRVEVLGADGASLRTFNIVDAATGMTSASGLTTDSANAVFVCDPVNHRVVKFDAQGNVLLTFGAASGTFTGLQLPQGISVDAAKHLFVADGNRSEIVEFDAAGKFLQSFGSDTLLAPSDVAVDAGGNLYVADGGHSRVAVFAPH